MEWRERALEISRRVALEFAQPHSWRIPEHYDAHWQPQLEHHRDRPDDQFQPYGATVGHGLEWSRLLLHLEASLADPPDWLLPAAEALFDRAVADGWAVDGSEGFVYTTDWDGRPVVRDRMAWVVAEAISAAAALRMRTGDGRYADLAAGWWAYAERTLFDRTYGSWYQQLDANNQRDRNRLARQIGSLSRGAGDVDPATAARAHHGHGADTMTRWSANLLAGPPEWINSEWINAAPWISRAPQRGRGQHVRGAYVQPLPRLRPALRPRVRGQFPRHRADPSRLFGVRPTDRIRFSTHPTMVVGFRPDGGLPTMIGPKR